MTPNLDDLLQRIGSELAKVLPDEGWNSAGIEAEMTDGSGRVRLWSSNDQASTRTYVGTFDISIRGFYDALREMRERHRNTAEGPWYRADFVMTPDGNVSVDFEYDRLPMEWNNRLNAATKARLKAYAEFGNVDDDIIAPMLGASFTGNAEWPCRPGWRVARSRKGVVVISDGLSDPYEDREGPGLGIEVFMQTKEKLLKRSAPINAITKTWLFSAVADVCNTVAGDGVIRELLDKQGVLTIEVGGALFPEKLQNENGRVGVLLGVPAVGVPERIQLAEGAVRLVALTLMTRDELDYVAKGGKEARTEVADRLAKKFGHLSMTKRASVV